MSKRIVILVSGNGSNAQAIIDACESGQIRGQVHAVISNKKDAYGLVRAKKHNIDAIAIPHVDFAARSDFEAELLSSVVSYQPDLVVLAGFMRILSEKFVNSFSGKILNIHPSLLPKYPGLNTHQRALDNGDEKHGSSVHFVTPELDGGPVILQGEVPVMTGDTPDILAKRLASVEWQIYTKVVKWFCDDKLHLDNNSVVLNETIIKKGGLTNEQQIIY